MAAKDQHKETIIKYLSDPDNEFTTRSALATDILGFAQQCQLYEHFTPDELSAIEQTALEIRRSKYASKISKVDMALLGKAAEGDTAAAKLVYQRFENWSEKKDVEISTPEDKKLVWEVTYRKPEEKG